LGWVFSSHGSSKEDWLVVFTGDFLEIVEADRENDTIRWAEDSFEAKQNSSQSTNLASKGKNSEDLFPEKQFSALSKKQKRKMLIYEPKEKKEEEVNLINEYRISSSLVKGRWQGAGSFSWSKKN